MLLQLSFMCMVYVSVIEKVLPDFRSWYPWGLLYAEQNNCEFSIFINKLFKPFSITESFIKKQPWVSLACKILLIYHVIIKWLFI